MFIQQECEIKPNSNGVVPTFSMDALNSEMGVCSNLKTGELGFTGFSIAHILIIIIIIIINVIIFN